MDEQPHSSREGTRFRTDDPDFADRIRELLRAEDDQDFEESEDERDNEEVFEMVHSDDDDADFVYNAEEDHGDDWSSDDDSEDGSVFSLNEITREEEENARLRNIDLEIPQVYLGKDDYEWLSEEPNPRVRTARENIIRGFPGLNATGRGLGDNPSPKQVWEILFDPEMISEILKWTNKKLENHRSAIDEALPGNTVNERNTKKNLLGKYRPTDFEEINAFLAILLFSSIYKGPKENIYSMFSKSLSGRQIMRAAMTGYRFAVLSAAMRFDDPETRVQRKESDKAAPISWLFDKFIANCKKPLNIGAHTCIDEMLVPFRGRCPFRTYMPNKPAKYGIKVQCLTDANTSYLYHAYIYIGKGSEGHGLSEEERKLSMPTLAAIRLTKSIVTSGKNVTADNWYCSVELSEELTKRGLTLVGTMKKNKRQIPPEFLPSPRRPVKSSIFGFSGNKTLVSYVPKHRRSVILLSSMHHSKEIDSRTGKPEIIMFYNKTKGGVDCLDQKCSKYSAARKCLRWPMAILFRMVEIGSSNSHLLYLCYRANPMIKRFKFVEQLVGELMRPHLEKRLEQPTLSIELKDLIRKALGQELPPPPAPATSGPPDRFEKKQTCKFCDPKLKRKTFYKCAKCTRPICMEHCRKICLPCYEENDDR